MIQIKRRVLLIVVLIYIFPFHAAHSSDQKDSVLKIRDQLLQALEEGLITGTLQSGAVQYNPIANAAITLYQARRTEQALVLGKTFSLKEGSFSIPFSVPNNQDAVLYLIAEGGTLQDELGDRNHPLKFAAVLGTAPFPSTQVINELTTVASAYAMAQFIEGENIAGGHPGLQNAAAMVFNLADSMGQVADVLGKPPNGSETTTRNQFNSLANMLAACINQVDNCSDFFELAKNPNGPVPTNTLQAMVNIAHNPWQNVSALFAIAQQSALYEPALSPSQSPDAWTLAIRYDDPLQRLDGPGNIAFDTDGNAWVNNNYTNNPDVSKVCGSDLVFAFKPTGSQLPGSPYGGSDNNGGLYGAGFGISVSLEQDTIEPQETVWVSNFGFQGSKCSIDSKDRMLLSESISQFGLDGAALSPNRVGSDPSTGGWRQGNILQPQGTAVDQLGNIWITNCGNASVTKYPKGIPENAQYFPVADEQSLFKPFGIAIDENGVAWITGNGSDSVIAIAQDGTILDVFTNQNDEDASFKLPVGIAVDSFGNKWVSNSDALTATCAGDTAKELISEEIANSETPPEHASVALIRKSGKVETFTGGGIVFPWGIAVDGDDNIFVANFGNAKNDQSQNPEGWDPTGLVHLCGAKPENCPPGHNTGDAISPGTGYTSDGLTRVTGVQIDPSGNVWMANNYTLDLDPKNPGGHQMVVFIGLAAPVKTPMAGPPQQP